MNTEELLLRFLCNLKLNNTMMQIIELCSRKKSRIKRGFWIAKSPSFLICIGVIIILALLKAHKHAYVDLSEHRMHI